MSEEGIAKGVRRIVAVTAAEATAAIAEGERLAGEVEAVAKLDGEQQDKAVSTLKQVPTRPFIAGVLRHVGRNCIVLVEPARQSRRLTTCLFAALSNAIPHNTTSPP